MDKKGIEEIIKNVLGDKPLYRKKDKWDEELQKKYGWKWSYKPWIYGDN